MTPSANTSVRVSGVPARSCSGAVYAGVPMDRARHRQVARPHPSNLQRRIDDGQEDERGG